MPETPGRVNMTSDGLALSPGEYADLLGRLAAEGNAEPDAYGAGGCVERLETEMAAALGKGEAVVMPTGTMANLLAVQYLAGTDRKVIVQHESHLYNDCGDCGPALAGLQLVPLGQRATFAATDVQGVIDRARDGKVEAPPGVISIETPVRRLDGEMFAAGALSGVLQLARAEGIRLHLDGARLPVVAARTGKTMAQLAAPFDTVYVSLYKCFNSLSGGILAGESATIGRLRHWRRRNGGGMAQFWPMAAVARHYLADVVTGLEEAFEIAGEFFDLLTTDRRFAHVPVANGSSVSRIVLQGTDRAAAETFRNRLASRKISLPPPDGEPPGFTIKANASWRRCTAAQLHAAFQEAIDGD